MKKGGVKMEYTLKKLDSYGVLGNDEMFDTNGGAIALITLATVSTLLMKGAAIKKAVVVGAFIVDVISWAGITYHANKKKEIIWHLQEDKGILILTMSCMLCGGVSGMKNKIFVSKKDEEDIVDTDNYLKSGNGFSLLLLWAVAIVAGTIIGNIFS